MSDNKQGESEQPNAGKPMNTFVKPNFNNPNNLVKGKGFNAPQKGMPGGFAPGTFKTQHKG